MGMISDNSSVHSLCKLTCLKLFVFLQAPQYYWEYMTLTGSYLLNGSRDSRLSVPVLAPPPSLCQPMVELFKAHEEKRVRLRVQHAIQREKLIISREQEIMRVHSRAARTNQNQTVSTNRKKVTMFSKLSPSFEPVILKLS